MTVIVGEDQLSLAIGKKGQNVRLATRLVGWDIKIVSEEVLKKEITQQMGKMIASGEAVPVTELEGVTPNQAEMLAEHGIEDIETKNPIWKIFALIKKLTDPKHHIEKTYWVMVEGKPTPEKLTQLENGIQLKDYLTLPAKARLIPTPNLPPRPKPVTPHGPTTWIEIKLREGKKRQIRHMTAAVNLFTLRLIRVAIGAIKLGDLNVGEWRELNADEIRLLKK
jgi:pseudouridine synthase